MPGNSQRQQFTDIHLDQEIRRTTVEVWDSTTNKWTPTDRKPLTAVLPRPGKTRHHHTTEIQLDQEIRRTAVVEIHDTISKKWHGPVCNFALCFYFCPPDTPVTKTDPVLVEGFGDDNVINPWFGKVSL